MEECPRHTSMLDEGDNSSFVSYEVKKSAGERTRVRLQLEFRLKVGAQSSFLSC